MNPGIFAFLTTMVFCGCFFSGMFLAAFVDTNFLWLMVPAFLSLLIFSIVIHSRDIVG